MVVPLGARNGDSKKAEPSVLVRFLDRSGSAKMRYTTATAKIPRIDATITQS
jgi:hypothetical protein